VRLLRAALLRLLRRGFDTFRLDAEREEEAEERRRRLTEDPTDVLRLRCRLGDWGVEGLVLALPFFFVFSSTVRRFPAFLLEDDFAPCFALDFGAFGTEDRRLRLRLAVLEREVERRLRVLLDRDLDVLDRRERDAREEDADALEDGAFGVALRRRRRRELLRRRADRCFFGFFTLRARDADRETLRFLSALRFA